MGLSSYLLLLGLASVHSWRQMGNRAVGHVSGAQSAVSTEGSDPVLTACSVSLQLSVFIHCVLKVLCLLVVPVLLYVFWFYVHLSILQHSGPHDQLMSSAFQASLQVAPPTSSQPDLFSSFNGSARTRSSRSSFLQVSHEPGRALGGFCSAFGGSSWDLLEPGCQPGSTGGRVAAVRRLGLSPVERRG